MSKGGIPRKATGPSLHSRAARRATSPGIDTDKSLKTARPPPSSLNERPSVLATHGGGGVTKKARKQGRKANPSTRARRRHDKAAERAEAVLERTKVKVARSRGQAHVLRSRRKPWDEVNDGIGPLKKEKSKGAAAAKRAEEDKAVEEFFRAPDEDMSSDAQEGQADHVDVQDAVDVVRSISIAQTGVVEPVSGPLLRDNDDEEEDDDDIQ